jgi:uncharacterized cupin superfamily protein
MTILRKGTVPVTQGVSGYPAPYNLGRGHMRWQHFGDAGGLTDFGVAEEVLDPGGQSSQPHWHTREDEFLYVLEGALTVVEDGVETVLGPGDAAAWKAGTPVAHTLRNRSGAPARYLIMGARRPDDVCHYPGLDMRATSDGYVHLDGTPYPKSEP